MNSANPNLSHHLESKMGVDKLAKQKSVCDDANCELSLLHESDVNVDQK
jgi:hypothetical protein